MAVKKTATKKRITKGVDKGQVHIQASFNNTIITITDERGNTVTASSAGATGLRGSRKRGGSERHQGHVHHGRFAHPSQRMQTAQAQKSLRRGQNGKNYFTRMQEMQKRRYEAVP